ncbi:MAG TPA: alpha/beta hydrolase [Solimonas sp.]|nr:alpha/beta hydrolase [Solimonas sp.]
MSTPSADYLAAPIERIDTGDATLALRRFGSGPALVLVHGFPLHGYTWRNVLPELSKHFTCYLPDLAGKGDSGWSAATEFTWAGHARRLKALLDHAGVQRYSLVAQDTGATIARRLALDDATRVDRLALINTEMPGHRPPWIRLYQWQMRLVPGAQYVFRQLMRSDTFLRSGMGFGGCFHDLSLIEGDFRAHFVTPYVESAHRTSGMARYLMGLHWDFVDSLRQHHAELKVPVLLVWGEDDPTFPVALARQMASQFPDCRGLVAIPKAKLLPHEERPAEVAQALRGFLSG